MPAVVQKHSPPKIARDLTVFLTHTIRRAAHSQSKGCHAERLAVILGINSAEIKKFVFGDFQALDEGSVKTIPQLTSRKRVVSGGDMVGGR